MGGRPRATDGLGPLFQQGPGCPHIGGLKSFLEPAANQCEGVAGLVDPSLFLAQPCKAHRAPQLPRQCLLPSGPVQGAFKMFFGFPR